MKRAFLMGLIVFSILLSQISFAQSNKDKKKGKKNKGKVEQVDVTTDKENNSQNKPGSVVTPVENEQPDGKAPQQQPSADRKPTTSSDNKPQQTAGITYSDVVNSTRPVVTQSANGSVNWTEQYIEAKGFAAIDTKNSNPAAAKAMAIRGATVVAQRNLLEIIKGVNVTSETKVKDMITDGDYIYTRVDGVIKGAELIGDAVEKDGLIEVRMRVPLYQANGLASALYDNIPANKSITISEATQQQLAQELQDQVLNALAFNMNGQKFDPALFPIIVDENGKLVFDFSKIYDPKKGDFPRILNATEEFMKELGYNKGVEYLDILRTEPGKIVLDNKNIRKINWDKIAKTAGTIGKFLMMFI